MATGLDGLEPLTATFNSSSLEIEKLKKIDHDHTMREDGAESVGRISTSSRPENYKNAKGERSKSNKFTELLLRLQNARLWLLQQIDILNDQLIKLIDERDDANETYTALNKFYNYFKDTGRFELDENGRPVDPLVLKAIEKWEQENGMPFDFTSEDSAVIIQGLIESEKLKIERINQTILDKQAEIEFKTNLLNDLDEEISNLNNGIEKTSTQINYCEIKLQTIETEMTDNQRDIQVDARNDLTFAPFKP